MLRIKDVLDLPVVRRALPDVIAGAEGLDRELRWAHVIEMADPSDLLKGGELVLTTGIGAGERERDQARWIASLMRLVVTGLLKTMKTWEYLLLWRVKPGMSFQPVAARYCRLKFLTRDGLV